MTAGKLSRDASRFLRENIRSMEDLKVLLLLRSRPGRSWEVKEVARLTNLDPDMASNHLVDLFARGLIEHDHQNGPLFKFIYKSKNKTDESLLFEISQSVAHARRQVE